MVASRVMMILSSLCMIVSRDFYTVAIAISISALSYNLASGTREALAYDSLKEAGMEKEYDAFASNDLMIPGGFLGAFCDNFLEVKTDVRLNHMIPSEQRATLMSVNSFTFSIVMIVLSPVFGHLFS